MDEGQVQHKMQTEDNQLIKFLKAVMAPVLIFLIVIATGIYSYRSSNGIFYWSTSTIFLLIGWSQWKLIKSMSFIGMKIELKEKIEIADNLIERLKEQSTILMWLSIYPHADDHPYSSHLLKDTKDFDIMSPYNVYRASMLYLAF